MKTAGTISIATFTSLFKKHLKSLAILTFLSLTVLTIFLIFIFESNYIPNLSLNDDINGNTGLMKTLNNSNTNRNDIYVPSFAEQYIVDHFKQLGYKEKNPEKLPDTCDLYTEQITPLQPSLEIYIQELNKYQKLVQDFSPIDDIRLSLQAHDPEYNSNFCEQLQLHPNGLSGIFDSRSNNNINNSQLSYSSNFGWIEPLLPPLRHPGMCLGGHDPFSLTFLVHDFSRMCQKLKPHSKIILLDAGASLQFESTNIEDQPIIYLAKLYRKFGFPFDHIYAFETRPFKPAKVFQILPDNLFASYHWINVGVESDTVSRLNPLKFLSDHFTENDFIVLKLDVDTPQVEISIVHQLLHDPNNHNYSKLIDSFYFEHHVYLKELYSSWKGVGLNESLADSIQLFSGLRKKGIAAHSWI